MHHQFLKEKYECPVCSETTWTYKFSCKYRKQPEERPIKYRYYFCNKCHLFRILPPLLPNQVKSFYPDNYGPYQLRDKKKRTNLIDWIRRSVLVHEFDYPNREDISRIPFIGPILKKKLYYIPKYVPNGRALDVGAGSGDYLDLLKDLGWKTIAVEMNEPCFNILLKKGHEGILGDFENATIPENYFDFISLFEVIEHLINPKQALKKIYSSLKPKGMLYLSTPNADSFLSTKMRSNWWSLDTPRHLQLFNPKNIELLLKEVGFVVDEYIIWQPSINLARSILFKVHDNINFGGKAEMTINLFSRIPSFFLSLGTIGDSTFIRAQKN